jgi:hypothetical protein
LSSLPPNVPLLIFKSPSLLFWIPEIAVCMSILWTYCRRIFHATLIRSHFHSLRLSWFSKPTAQSEGIVLYKSSLTVATSIPRLTHLYLLVNARDSRLSLSSSHFAPLMIYLSFGWFALIIFLYNIHRLDLIMEEHRVLCEVPRE